MEAKMNNSAQGVLDASPLTDDQKTALIAMQAFVMNGNEKCFLLEGYAGTGKTFLIRRFVQWLESKKWSCVLAAPTGRAGKVLADKTGFEAGTIHRSIYSMDKLEEIPNAKAEDRFKFYYALKLVAPDVRPRVIVIDEASMVSDVESDEKFIRFGSGRLLKDLMEYAGEIQPDSKCQIVFVGDPAQLPPVGMNYSPALDSNYLKNEFDANSRQTVLRQVVRQGEGSAILLTATQIRGDIEQGRVNRLDIHPDGKDAIELDLAGVMELWARLCPPDREPSVSPPLVCVVWKNDTGLAYNASVRAKLHGSRDGLHPVQPRDYLMVVANSRKTGLTNGELVLVKSVDGEAEIHEVGIRNGEERKTVVLIYRKLTLAVPDTKGCASIIESMILENVLFGKERDMTEDEFIAQQVFFKNRHPGLSVRSEQFKLELNNDPYFNALRVKFGYAVTCNKAQGGEWPSAVVIFERGRPSLDCLRWTYTAITRAKQTLYGVGFPHYRIIDWSREGKTKGNEYPEPTNDSASPVEANAPEQEIVGNIVTQVITENDIKLFRLAGFPADMDWMLPQHIAALREWQGAGIVVDRIELALKNYYFRYHLAKEGHRAMIQVYFNASKALKPMPGVAIGSPTSTVLCAECDECLARAYQSAYPVTTDVALEAVELNEFRGLYITAIARLGGALVAVKHFPYRERYRGRSAHGGIAVIDFPYNGRMKFSRPPEIQPETTDRAFALAIIRELEK